MKKYWILFVFVPLIGHSQTITTIAGNGSSSYSGNGVPATAAGVPNACGGAFDKYGNYYFTDAINSHTVRKIDVTGIITTVAGTGVGGFGGDGTSATSAKLFTPWGIALDTFGNLYIADGGNNRVRKVNISTGDISTFAGTGTGGGGGDNAPATSAEIWNPNDVCFDKFGNLYISDLYNYKIRKINSLGIITTFAGTGTPGYFGDGGPATAANINVAQGIATDDTGNIYIADGSNGRVRKVNTMGIISTIAGNGLLAYVGDGIPATNAQIAPIKVAIDDSGNLFIADKTNRRVFKVDGVGMIHAIAGNGTTGFSGDGGPAVLASLDYPSGISFDQCNNLYIPDVNNRRIRKVLFNPTCDLESLNTNVISNNEIISVYPNPVNDELHIDNAKPGTKYAMVSIVGAVLHRGTLHAKENSISIRNLPPGIYLLQLTDVDGVKMVKRIIKE